MLGGISFFLTAAIWAGHTVDQTAYQVNTRQDMRSCKRFKIIDVNLFDKRYELFIVLPWCFVSNLMDFRYLTVNGCSDMCCMRGWFDLGFNNVNGCTDMPYLPCHFVSKIFRLDYIVIIIHKSQPVKVRKKEKNSKCTVLTLILFTDIWHLVDKSRQKRRQKHKENVICGYVVMPLMKWNGHLHCFLLLRMICV